MLGLGVWVALAFGGVWFVHQFTRSKASCGGQIETRTAQPKGEAAGPRFHASGTPINSQNKFFARSRRPGRKRADAKITSSLFSSPKI